MLWSDNSAKRNNPVCPKTKNPKMIRPIMSRANGNKCLVAVEERIPSPRILFRNFSSKKHIQSSPRIGTRESITWADCFLEIQSSCFSVFPLKLSEASSLSGDNANSSACLGLVYAYCFPNTSPKSFSNGLYGLSRTGTLASSGKFKFLGSWHNPK